MENWHFGFRSPNIIVGYLFEWQNNADLASIPNGYNVVALVFSPDNSGAPNLRPLYVSDDAVTSAVETLKSEGRSVLVTLGGANTYVALTEDDKETFQEDVMNAIDHYGFDGINIDLEGSSITAADNQTVIPEALRELKEYYRLNGKDFIITLSPEFPALRGPNALYAPYIEGLDESYDFVFPQYYNQGSDGIWYGNTYLAQDDNENKAPFLYTLTNAIINGTQDYVPIPADKLAIGLPSSPDAAFNGYVENPMDVAYALDQLALDGTPIRGLMTWSINQDADNGYQFIRDYAPIVYSS